MRAVIAEDSALVREGLRLLLERAGWSVPATVASGEELVDTVESTGPDLVIADIRMPPTFADEGLQAALVIRAKHPGMGILLLSQHIEVHATRRLLSGGAAGVGYLLKQRVLRVDDFLGAVDRVAQGGSAIDPVVVEALMATASTDRLTERERNVLALMAEGLSNETIRRRLFVTAKTIEAHIGSIFSKLGLTGQGNDHRRVAAVLTWLRDQGDLF